jgi:general stress protein 26
MSELTIDKLDTLIEGFDTAMLTTRTSDTGLRARPMAIAEHQEGGVLYFATHARDGKVEEIIESPRVAVTMQAEDTYLSISGEARVLTNQVLADELWSASMRLWFPEGREDPNLAALLVEPRYAEYWDRSGMRRLEFWWEAGKALVKGETPDDEDLSGHDKVRL